MNYKMVFYTIGRIFLIMAGFLLVPMFVAVGYGESVLPYIYTILMFIVPGILLSIKKPKEGTFQKEATVSIGLAWILVSLIGAFVYIFSGTIVSFVDAFFEMVSGITTTGSTILTDIEALPKGISFFRCFTNWIGGMGILVFLLAIMPKGEQGGIHLLRAESPGPNVGKMTTKLSTTARILYLIYIGLTLVQFCILLIGGVDWFNAATLSFSTAGTGGFAPTNMSIASYNSLFIELVVAIFMFIFSINFGLFFLYFIGKGLSALKSEEFWTFFIIVALSTILIAINITSTVGNFWTALRYSIFEVSSTASSTGFASADYNQWPAFSQSLLMIVMMIGGCAGSTAGGLKVSRLVGLTKSSFVKVKQTLNPRKVFAVRVEGKTQDESYINSLFFYFGVYMFILLVFTVICSLDSSLTFGSSLSACIATFNNAGPGIDAVGPMANYAGLAGWTKMIFSMLMLTGRLEVFPMLILFMPSTWRRVNVG